MFVWARATGGCGFERCFWTRKCPFKAPMDAVFGCLFEAFQGFGLVRPAGMLLRWFAG